MIKGDSHSSLLLFPDGDVSINTVQRKFRTVQYPVPGQAKSAIVIVSFTLYYNYMYVFVVFYLVYCYIVVVIVVVFVFNFLQTY